MMMEPETVWTCEVAIPTTATAKIDEKSCLTMNAQSPRKNSTNLKVSLGQKPRTLS